jgi:hypothetical protein
VHLCICTQVVAGAAAGLKPGHGAATPSGVAVELDDKGLARQIAPMRIGGRLAEARPGFWE